MVVGIRAHVLDNAVWHSLTGDRRAFGTVTAHAGRFDPEVAMFSAVDDDAGPEAWDELRELAGGRGVTLFRPGVVVPDGWETRFRGPGVQMVADGVVDPAVDERFVPLGADDVPEMLELIAATKPGPFLARTVELGGYLGLREDGVLVAMAGERLRGGGYTEISAVCTLPTHRGTGLATALVLALVHDIRARGEEAYLHAASDNVNAIRLYLALGFSLRRDDVDAIGLKAPA